MTRTTGHVVTGGGIEIWAPISLWTFRMYKGIDWMCACQNRYGYPNLAEGTDTPFLLRYLAHKTTYTQACCALNALNRYIVHAHFTLIGWKFNHTCQMESCQIR